MQLGGEKQYLYRIVLACFFFCLFICFFHTFFRPQLKSYILNFHKENVPFVKGDILNHFSNVDTVSYSLNQITVTCFGKNSKEIQYKSLLFNIF